MKHRLAPVFGAVLLAVCSTVPAYADPAGTSVCIYTPTARTPAADVPILPACNASGQLITSGAAATVTPPVRCAITTTTATPCSAPSSLFIGAIGNSTAAQTASVACTWTGDGVVVPPLGAGQITNFEPNGPGYPMGTQTTATCTASAAPVTTGTPTGGAGIVLLFR